MTTRREDVVRVDFGIGDRDVLDDDRIFGSV